MPNNLKTTPLPREFLYSGVIIPDPNPALTVEQVQEVMATSYPEIATASVSGPEDTGRALRFKFERSIGVKG